MIFAIFATCFFSMSAIAANRAISTFGSLKTNALRLLIVAVVGALWAFTYGCGALGAGAWWMLLSGVVGFGLGDIGLFLALPLIGSRLSVLMTQCLAVPFAALTEWLWRGTILTRTQSAAALLILGGVALALLPHGRKDLAAENAQNAMRWSVAGVLLGTLSAAGQGSGAVLSRYAFDVVRQQNQQLDGLTATWQRAISGVVIALLAWWWLEKPMAATASARNTDWQNAHNAVEPNLNSTLMDSRASISAVPVIEPMAQTQKSSHGARWLCLHALLGPMLGVASLQTALKSTPSALVLSITAITPLLVVPLAWWLEGDQPTPRALIGAAVAVVGVTLAVNAG